MSIIRIESFRGMAPRYAKRKLADTNAQKALNTDLWSGELRSIRSGFVVASPSKDGDINSLFPLNSKWLHWNEDVDVAQSPLNVDDEGRIYYTGNYNPKSTNGELATSGGGTAYPIQSYALGLPEPENGPSIGITGGSSGVQKTRSYCYTYVTEWGEEGPPSSPVEYTAAHDDATSWDLTGMDTAPLNAGSIIGAVVAGGVTTFETSADHFLETGTYVDITGITGTGDLPAAFNDVGPLQATRVDSTHFSIALTPSGGYTSGGTWSRDATINTTNMTKRIYRTTLGLFKLVAEIPVAQTTYTDSLDDDELDEEIPGIDSLAWSAPHGDMQGITIMAGGIAVGFYENVLSFSPAYAPHAYPEAYKLTLDYTIVAIEAIGNTLVVGTVGKPYVVTGVDPAGMVETRLDLSQSCISKQSMVSILNGAMYASPDGLIYVPVSGQAQIITRNWLKETDWRKYNPGSIKACVYDDRYYAFYSGAGEDSDESGGIVFDPSEPDSTFTELGFSATACYSDLTTDRLYYYDEEIRSVYRFGYGGGYEVFEWTSKMFTSPRPICFKSGLVRFTPKAGILEAEITSAKAAVIESIDEGIDNGSIITSGEFAGAMPGEYTVAGGPYMAATIDIESNISATFRLYADDALKFEKSLLDSKPFRIPGGYRADSWTIELSGSGVDIHEAFVAESMSEIARG